MAYPVGCVGFLGAAAGDDADAAVSVAELDEPAGEAILSAGSADRDVLSAALDPVTK